MVPNLNRKASSYSPLNIMSAVVLHTLTETHTTLREKLPEEQLEWFIQLVGGGMRFGTGDVDQKGKRTHGLGQQCGDCWGKRVLGD